MGNIDRNDISIDSQSLPGSNQDLNADLSAHIQNNADEKGGHIFNGAVDVIGFGLSIDDLTERHKNIICQADILVGGRRHLTYFNDLLCEKITITKDIKNVVAAIKQEMESGRNIVVIASGDPLFHGIGRTLIEALGRDNVNIYPNISSVAAAFAAIKEPWENAKLVSLHGKDADKEFLKIHHSDISGNKKHIAILTDHIRTPAWIAERLVRRNMSYFRMYVFENLGSYDEKISFYDDLEVASKTVFSNPNVVILKQMDSSSSDKQKNGEENVPAEIVQGLSLPIYTGMPDDLFFHEKGLITKSEIRAIVLSKLQLNSDNHVFWDLGAGSGSVSIEVSRFIPKGQIFAVEKNERRISDIKKNMVKFRIFGSAASENISHNNASKNDKELMQVVHGELPDAMKHLPDPDRIFIGGGGVDITDIIQKAGERLATNGIMVINTVLVQTMNFAMATLKNMGFHVKLVQVQVSISKQMPFGERLDALNPVWIISGKKS